MHAQETQASFTVNELSLPKGGGAIQNALNSHGPIGPTGTASQSLALPISDGRGYAPDLALHYSSTSGNGLFGIGWQVPVMSIARRANTSVPRYTEEDEFVGPDGEILVPERDSQGQAVTTYVNAYGEVTLSTRYLVRSYLPRVEGAFDRIEHWQPEATNHTDFWLIHTADGQLHLLGKTSAARITDPANPASRTACWLLEESVSPTGEHIGYRYVDETQLSLSNSIKEINTRDRQANRYLATVCYGNVRADAHLFLLQKDNALTEEDWLFSLVFDYGARGIDPLHPASFEAVGNDCLRADPFSSYAFGFEVRTRVLCQQVLMFHHFPDKLSDAAVLTARLQFEYDNHSLMSQLVAAHSLAYEPDGTLLTLPPIEWEYSKPLAQAESTLLGAEEWQAFPALPGLNDGVHFQLVDLYGEGIPGILAACNGAWYYRAPQRDTKEGAHPDAISYASAWQLLPTLPVGATQASLMDIDGDGQLDWVVTRPGLAGFFTQHADTRWSSFIPFKAVPMEYFHPQAQMADIVGAGRPDLVLIGPHSVRLYANQKADGFASPIDVAQEEGMTLPIQGQDATELVAFSDVLGSGQSHLVSVRQDRVTCWPNLGRGRFGIPLTFMLATALPGVFDPRRVYLADLDGSGAVDLIYADTQHLIIYLNQAGNGFAPAPLFLPYPNGRKFDQLSAISFADVMGKGIADIILSVPYSGTYQAPQHWHYRFATQKPYLLIRTDNNHGAATQITYRSSVQAWLDEKQELTQLGQPAVCALPFPMHLVASVITHDQLTQNQLVQSYRYRKGVYDHQEREFRGFGYLEVQDSLVYPATAYADPATAFSPPLRTCTWYHTGRSEDEGTLYTAVTPPYRGDAKVWTLPATRFTQFSDASGIPIDTPYTPEGDEVWWLYRALKGSLLRQEVYGLDGSEAQPIPYSVTFTDYQVRRVQTGTIDTALEQSFPPVALAGLSEQLTYNYERSPTDPLITQQLMHTQDRYGALCRSFSITYPRRSQQANPYPALQKPDSLWEDSYDEQQQKLRLIEQRQSWFHLNDAQAWRLHLPSQSRTEYWTFTEAVSAQYPNGVHLDDLRDGAGLLGQTENRVFGGQSVVHYVNQSTPSTPPDFIALIEHHESALLDASNLTAYEEALNEAERQQLLTEGGYVQREQVLLAPGQTSAPVWCVLQGYTAYGTAQQFYRPLQQWSTALTAPGSTAQWDTHFCVIERTEDACHNIAQAEYDYRFLQPYRLIDLNNNIHEVQYDAMGRVLANTTYGTELAAWTDADKVPAPVRVGFHRLALEAMPGWEDWPSAARPIDLSVEAAIAQGMEAKIKQTLPTMIAFDPFSWMGRLPRETIDAATWQQLVSERYLTEAGYLRARAWDAYAEPESTLPAAVRTIMSTLVRLPVHHVTLTADRYPPDPAQRIQVGVAYYDGLGRPLQACAWVPSGMAWLREDNGELATASDGTLLAELVESRWNISGRLEYNNKGQVIRAYQPYFVNSWRYIVDHALRTGGYADTHYYDALGRETQVFTALQWQRRIVYTPWLTAHRDENDNWQSAQQGALALDNASRSTEEQALCADTPDVIVNDNRGLPVRKLQYNRTPAALQTNLATHKQAAVLDHLPPLTSYITRSRYTDVGYLYSEADARMFAAGKENFQYQVDLAGQQLYANSLDAGKSWNFSDIEGRTVWSRDARGTVTRCAYDVLGRMILIYEQRFDEATQSQLPLKVRERFFYGDDPASDFFSGTHAQQANLRGVLVKHWDTAGLSTVPGHTLSAQPQVQIRQLLTQRTGEGDWSNDNEADWLSQLEITRYLSQWQYDAQGKPLTQIDAKGHTTTTRYDQCGRLFSSAITLSGQNKPKPLLESVSYSAAGQVEKEIAGNGVTTEYDYEPQTQRLRVLTTTRPAQAGREETLQELHYTYDPVGNITEIEDRSQADRFTRNQRVRAINHYQYDALYQLITARGREQANAPEQGPALPAPISMPVDMSMLVNYERRYTYDIGGNLQQIRHAGARSYTRDIVVSATSNRAVQQNANQSLTPENVDTPAWFDRCGNSLRLQPDTPQPLQWNGRNQLSMATQLERATVESSDREHYQYGASGFRTRKTSFSYGNGAQTEQCDDVIYLPGLELRTRTLTVNGTTTTEEALQVITAPHTGGAQARVLHWNAGQPADIPNDQLRYSFSNQVGSVTLELDEAADIISWEEYYPFGGTAILGARTQSEVKYKFIRYSAKERDATGLYYYGYRYYQPWLGRWLNPDPAGTIDGLNLFLMVSNNPITLHDSVGLNGSKKSARIDTLPHQPTHRGPAKFSALGRVPVKLEGSPDYWHENKLESTDASGGTTHKLIYSFNTRITGKNLVNPLDKLSRRNSITQRKITILSGSHGSVDGNNWSEKLLINNSGRRSQPLIDKYFYMQDKRNIKRGYGSRYTQDFLNRVKVVDMEGMTSGEFKDRVKDPNQHLILAYCYSRNDDALRYSAKLNPVISYLKPDNSGESVGELLQANVYIADSNDIKWFSIEEFQARRSTAEFYMKIKDSSSGQTHVVDYKGNAYDPTNFSVLPKSPLRQIK